MLLRALLAVRTALDACLIKHKLPVLIVILLVIKLKYRLSLSVPS